MKQTLYFFTYTFPYGRNVQWKTKELQHLSQEFEHIHILPLKNGEKIPGRSQSAAIDLPANCEVHPPFFHSLARILQLFFTNFSSLRYYFDDFICCNVYRSIAKTKSWVKAVVVVRSLMNHPLICKIEKLPSENAENVVLYFYWGTGSTYVVPFLQNRYRAIVARFHGGDLYEERNNGYIPFRTKLFSRLTHSVFISDNGYHYAVTKYPVLINKSKVFRLGTSSFGRALPSQDGVLRIVSCAFISPVKRVPLIIGALKLINISIEWTHIGDGLDFEKTRSAASHLPPNIKVNWLGGVPSEKVPLVYVNNYFDIFINVSSSEGIPVSIMEALAAGIPVFATNVGGVSEIIDDNVGCLLNPNIAAEGLAQKIIDFSVTHHDRKQLLRNNAFQRFAELCNADVLYEAFARHLRNMPVVRK